MKRVAAIAIVLVLVAVGLQAQSSAPGESAGTPVVSEPAVATFAGQAITASRIEAEAGARLLKVRNEEYKIKAELARTIAFGELQEKAARELEIDRGELYRRNVVAKAGEPSKEEIDELLKRYRAQLPPDEQQARQQVVEFLTEQRVRTREQSWRREILASAGFKLHIEPPRVALTVGASDPVLGAATAPVTLVEFSDFQCPYCSRVQTTVQRLKQSYGDRLRFVFKQLPLAMHQHAVMAAEASLCAGQQAKFWEMHDWLFANQQRIAPEGIKAAAAELKLDGAAFTACLDEKRFAGKVQEDLKLAESLGINGTPAFLVNGRFLEGAQPFEAFQEVIEDEFSRAAVAAK